MLDLIIWCLNVWHVRTEPKCFNNLVPSFGSQSYGIATIDLVPSFVKKDPINILYILTIHHMSSLAI